MIDIVFIAAIWVITYFFRYDTGFFDTHKGVPSLERHLILSIPVCLLIFGACVWAGLYRPRRLHNIVLQFWDVIKATAAGTLLVLTFLYYTQETVYSRRLMVLFVPLLWVVLTITHLGAIMILREFRKRGYNLRYCAIIGAGKKGQQLWRDIGKMPWLGMRCAYFIDNNTLKIGGIVKGAAVYGPVASTLNIVQEHPVDEIYLTLSGDEGFGAYSVLEKLQTRGITIRIVPDWGNLTSTHTTAIPIGSQLLFCAADSPLGGYMVVLKEIFDKVVAASIILILAVPMLIIGVMVKLTSAGPVLYKQARIGMDQRKFMIYKFRTMKVDAEKISGISWSKPDGSLYTGVGGWLRRTSLDELPQLFNVLKGDMSLVGPRPERPMFVDQFSQEFKDYMLRHRVKSGITGWAQIHGFRGESSLKKRIQYDLFYVRNWSFSIDIWILLLTPLHVLKGTNAN
ncbi:MAG: undecaprenyl-phosphate glucose phosphotransferase [Planctomycetes bacterium GWC2_49_10]|nr:MAG: undecaprenyl-phosphate glucose phosphotransferase [Planctomycetes bacterium GWC2_49_10]